MLLFNSFFKETKLNLFSQLINSYILKGKGKSLVSRGGVGGGREYSSHPLLCLGFVDIKVVQEYFNFVRKVNII